MSELPKGIAALAAAVEQAEKPAPQTEVTHSSSVFAQDFKMPRLDDAIVAALVVTRCRAIFAGQYWVLDCDATGKRTHMSVDQSYEDWVKAMNRLTPDGAFKFGV